MTADPRAVLTRPAPAPDLTAAYGPHPDHVIDLRLPPPGVRQAGPLVIFIHGGFWRAEYDRTHTGPLAADLARRGWPIATIEYRRTGQPGGGWPGTFDDVAAAVARTPELVPAGLDVARPIVAGHSAGGQLALWYAGTAPAGVRGALALAPVADLAEAFRLDLGGGAVSDLMGGGPHERPERYAQVDPSIRPYPQVPTVVVHGDRDLQVPVAIGREWVLAAQTSGAPAKLVELPGIEHFGLIDPESPAWPAVLNALASLM
jgi:acetyl esterase/lipase